MMYSAQFYTMGNVLSRQRLHRYRVAVMTPLVSSSHYCSYSSFKTISDQQKHQEFSTKVYADKPKIISRLRWARGKVKAYLELAKYKLSALVVVTSGAGFISAGALDSSIISACIGTALCAAAAGTFNQYIERDRDILMNRTRTRPLPSKRVSPTEALCFGGLAATSGVSLLYTIHPVCAALGLSNIILYAGPYTYSKPHAEVNTWIGAVVGAVPPLIGWSAATEGSLLTTDPFLLALILYYWQFPHFFALSWLHREDYARGGFQMVAVNDPKGARSADLIFKYTCYLSTLPVASSALGVTSYMFAFEGTLLNGYMLYLAHRFSQEQSNKAARKVFLSTLWYLPLLLAGFVFHNRNWDTLEENIRSTPMMVQFLHFKEQMKSICVHEFLREKGALCPKIQVNEAVETVKQVVENTEQEARDRGV